MQDPKSRALPLGYAPARRRSPPPHIIIYLMLHKQNIAKTRAFVNEFETAKRLGHYISSIVEHPAAALPHPMAAHPVTAAAPDLAAANL